MIRGGDGQPRTCALVVVSEVQVVVVPAGRQADLHRCWTVGIAGGRLILDASRPRHGRQQEHRELGKLPRTLPIERSYSSERIRTDRGCPWLTAADRCVGHIRGTAAGLAAAIPVAARVAERWC